MQLAAQQLQGRSVTEPGLQDHPPGPWSHTCCNAQAVVVVIVVVVLICLLNFKESKDFCFLVTLQMPAAAEVSLVRRHSPELSPGLPFR